MIRIVVAGSRGFADYEMFEQALDEMLETVDGEIELVSGHAEGADQMAERYAAEYAIPIMVMKPDWKKFGRAAGPVRNRQMLDYAAEGSPMVAAFWDGKSRGTKNTIDTARKLGIPTRVFRFS